MTLETEAKAIEAAVQAAGSTPTGGKLKRYGLLALAALLLLLAGYASGRWAQPPKVVEKTVVQTKVQEQVVYKDRVVTQTVYVKVAKKDSHVVTSTTKRPDGTVTTTVTRDDHVDSTTKNDGTKTETASKVDHKTEDQKATSTKTADARPNWIVHAGVGADVPYFLGGGERGIPGMRGAAVELGLDRRVVGPFFLGVNATSTGLLLLRLSLAL